MLEEVPVRAYGEVTQKLGPDLGECRLDRPAWRDEVGVCVSRAWPGSGRACRSTFPLGVSGNASKLTIAEGTI